jgi:hypothetical protein
MINLPSEQLEALNSDEAIQKRSSRLGFRACIECGHQVGVGYKGFVFTECPVCSGSLEEPTKPTPKPSATLFRVEKLGTRGDKITHLNDVDYSQADTEARRLVEQGESTFSLVRYGGANGVFVSGYQWLNGQVVRW